MTPSSLRFGILVVAFSALTACGGKGDSSTGGAGSDASCTTTSDCGSGELCVTEGSDSTCSLDCTASVSACGASASCEGVGTIGVSVCQPAQPPASPSNPPTVAKQPKLSCKTDADCSAIHAGTVCAEWMGGYACTNPCTKDSQCNPPPLGGVIVDLFSCQEDQGMTSRNVCLPRAECVTNPVSCVTFPSLCTGSAGGGLP